MAAQCSGSSAPIRAVTWAPQSPPCRAVAPIVEAGHEGDERLGDPSHVPATNAGRLREPVAGQRRRHHMDRICRPTTVRRGIGESRDHLEELDDRAWPTMGEEQRKGALVGRPGMDEVDRLPVDPGTEVGEAVEAGLLPTPVVGVQPVLDQFAQVGDRDAGVPLGPRDLVREAGTAEAAVQVLEVRLVHPDVKGLDWVGHRLRTPVTVLSFHRKAVRRG